MATKAFLSSLTSVADNICRLHELNPDATYGEIAAMASVSPAYVRKVAQRRGLSFKKLKVKRKSGVSKITPVDSGYWEDVLVERWADRPKRAVEKPAHGYQASGRQGSYVAYGHMRLI